VCVYVCVQPLSSVDVPASKARGDGSRSMDRLLSLDRAQFMTEVNDEKSMKVIIEKLKDSLL
jgi:hypothetical protein